MNIDETTENSDYVKLLILVKNMDLKEYYDYNNESELIYYYVWNIKNICQEFKKCLRKNKEQLQKNKLYMRYLIIEYLKIMIYNFI